MYRALRGGPENCYPGQMYYGPLDTCLCLPGYVPDPTSPGCIPVGQQPAQQSSSSNAPAVTFGDCAPGQVYDELSGSCICMDGYLPSPDGNGCIHVTSSGITSLPPGTVQPIPNVKPGLPPLVAPQVTKASTSSSATVTTIAIIGIASIAIAVILARD